MSWLYICDALLYVLNGGRGSRAWICCLWCYDRTMFNRETQSLACPSGNSPPKVWVLRSCPGFLAHTLRSQSHWPTQVPSLVESQDFKILKLDFKSPLSFPASNLRQLNLCHSWSIACHALVKQVFIWTLTRLFTLNRYSGSGFQIPTIFWAQKTLLKFFPNLFPHFLDIYVGLYGKL